MIDLVTRYLQLVRAVLDQDEIRYFSAAQKLIVYIPCKADLKHRTLRPVTLRVTISPCDTGILFEASLPVALQTSSEEERRLILRQITKENYGRIRGGLTYKSETDLLSYRVFYALGEDEACFDNEEVVACVKLSATAISDGYESIVNTLDESECDNDGEADNFEDTPESINAELKALFDRLHSTCDESESMYAFSSEHDPIDPIDYNEVIPSDEYTDGMARQTLRRSEVALRHFGDRRAFVFQEQPRQTVHSAQTCHWSIR